MIFLQTNWILAFVCAITYFNMGKFEARHGGRSDPAIWWALMSIVASALVIQLLSAGWMLVLLAQVGLFIGITIWRSMRE
jgi:hypothetical protein